MKATETIYNISSTKLIESEMSLLNKGLNFCPATKKPNKEKLLEDLHFFCRKFKLKEYLYDADSINDKIQGKKRRDLNTKLPNCFFSLNRKIQRYISVVQKEVTELIKSSICKRGDQFKTAK